MLENKFKQKLSDELKSLFPGCMIIHTDPNVIQGLPDLIILYNNKWAALEGKKSIKEKYQPNQEYYIETLNNMSYASMICPENKEVVLNDLQSTFRS